MGVAVNHKFLSIYSSVFNFTAADSFFMKIFHAAFRNSVFARVISFHILNEVAVKLRAPNKKSCRGDIIE